MFHCIQILTNTCEVTLQVKRGHGIGKTTLHRLLIYDEYMCLCWDSKLLCMICCLSSNFWTVSARVLIYNILWVITKLKIISSHIPNKIQFIIESLTNIIEFDCVCFQGRPGRGCLSYPPPLPVFASCIVNLELIIVHLLAR